MHESGSPDLEYAVALDMRRVSLVGITFVDANNLWKNQGTARLKWDATGETGNMFPILIPHPGLHSFTVSHLLTVLYGIQPYPSPITSVNGNSTLNVAVW